MIEMRVLVIPDAHVPFHNPQAFALIKHVARKAKATHGVCIGDFCDLYAINAHGLAHNRRADLEHELDTARALLKPVRALFDSFHFVAGNHEFRYDRYIDANAPRIGKVVPNIREQLDIPKKEWTPYRQHMFIGKMGFTHDLGFSGANALKQSLDAFGGNICLGHTHRGGVTYTGDTQGERHVGLNVGWIGDPAACDYMHASQMRHWQLGFGVVNIMSDGLAFAQFCPIINGQTCVDGKVYQL